MSDAAQYKALPFLVQMTLIKEYHQCGVQNMTMQLLMNEWWCVCVWMPTFETVPNEIRTAMRIREENGHGPIVRKAHKNIWSSCGIPATLFSTDSQWQWIS